MDWDAIQQWLNVIDQLSYYDLFSLPPHAGQDDLKRAFYTFADTFHPDAHVGRPKREREAITFIFKRGTEAYRVLADPLLRQRYDDALRMGQLRPADIASIPPMRESVSSIAPPPQRLVDKVRKPAARPFVMRAEELFKKGDAKQAKIQLVLAMHLDAGNPALEELMKQIETAITAAAEAERLRWRRKEEGG